MTRKPMFWIILILAALIFFPATTIGFFHQVIGAIQTVISTLHSSGVH